MPARGSRRTLGGSEEDLESREKLLAFAFPVSPQAQTPPPTPALFRRIYFFNVLRSSSPLPSFCRLLPPCPSFPLGRQPCALEALRDETTDWSCSRGGEGGVSQKKRKTRKAPEKAWMALQPRHQPATKLDVVKLSNYLSNCSKTSGGEKQRGRGDFFPPIVLQNKMVFIKKT